MPTTTIDNPRRRDTTAATRARIKKARDRRFAAVVAEMRETGLRVTVVETVPGATYDIEREVYRP